MEKKWEEMSPDEKQEVMFQRWLSPEGVEFASPEAEKLYKERVTRIKDVVQLKKLPDRVPIFPFIGFFPAYYAGFTPHDIMYDYEKLFTAFRKYVLDFEPDINPGAFFTGSGKLFEIIDFKLYAWPGHGVAPEHTYQCVEGEYMKADEYDALILDPTHFWSSTYMPRICGVMESLTMMQSPINVQEGAIAGYLLPFGLPNVQAAYKTLFEAGAEVLKLMGVIAGFDKEMTAAGFPAFLGGLTKAPFDVIGDTLRGTRGIMLDMYKQPDKLLKALEVLTPLMINMGVSMARMHGNPLTLITLHKGADGFMSDKQFKTFYWPSLKNLIIGLMDEGCVPFLFVEGSYNSRLDTIKDIPAGKSIWLFDQTDMEKAKEKMGRVACIGGNVPIDLFTVGTAPAVEEYAKKLIDTVGKGGGYIMANGAVINEGKPENLKAMVDFTKKYGIYK
jgi:hypothetical protein